MDCIADSGEVCGSDSITYTSQCELNRQNCLNGRNVTISYDGICYSKCTVSLECTAITAT